MVTLTSAEEALKTLGFDKLPTFEELRNRFKSQSKEILLPFDINYELNGVTITVPQRGDKKKLLDLSYCKEFFHML